jgi:excisionase family DNA binding protein
LLTVAEVAARLQLSRKTAYRLCDRGELPSLRVSGNAIRVLLQDLEAFVEGRRRGKA